MAPPSLAHVVPHAPSASSDSSPSRLLTPTTNPIPPTSASSGRLYALLHTALVPALYLLRSGPLVTDPLSTLTYDLIPLATAQATFCVLCLPAAGTWNNGTKDGGRGIVEGTASATHTSIKSGKGSLGRRKGAKTAAHLNDPSVGGFSARIMVRTLPSSLPTIPVGACEVGHRTLTVYSPAFSLCSSLY